MEIDNLVRDADKVKKTLVEMNGRLITKTGCVIHMPKHYASGLLGTIEANIHALGLWAMIVDDKYYAVNNVAGKITLTPDTVNIISVDETDYLELTFLPGSTIIDEINLLQDGPFMFNIYDEIIAKGKTPWYMDYDDLASIFDTAIHHGGVNLKAPRSILEMMTASRGRNPKDRSKYFRNSIKTQQEYKSKTPDIIPLRSVAYGATNTTSRLLGSHLNEGLTSALVNQSENNESVEDLLMM